jgi:hypothetical protein
MKGLGLKVWEERNEKKTFLRAQTPIINIDF